MPKFWSQGIEALSTLPQGDNADGWLAGRETGCGWAAGSAHRLSPLTAPLKHDRPCHLRCHRKPHAVLALNRTAHGEVQDQRGAMSNHFIPRLADSPAKQIESKQAPNFDCTAGLEIPSPARPLASLCNLHNKPGLPWMLAISLRRRLSLQRRLNSSCSLHEPDSLPRRKTKTAKYRPAHSLMNTGCTPPATTTVEMDRSSL